MFYIVPTYTLVGRVMYKMFFIVIINRVTRFKNRVYKKQTFIHMYMCVNSAYQLIGKVAQIFMWTVEMSAALAVHFRFRPSKAWPGLCYL